MYIVLDENIIEGNECSIATYRKRFFDETLEELSNGGSALKNYRLGDKLYFYDIKDSLKIEKLENGSQLFSFKVVSEISYKNVVKGNPNSYLRLFKFAENLNYIAKSKDKAFFVKELMNRFDFIDLIGLYSYILSKKIELNSNDFNELISLYETAMIKKSYKEIFSSLMYFHNLLSTGCINKREIIDRYKSIIINEKEISHEFLSLPNHIFEIKDVSIIEELLVTYLKNCISIIIIEQNRDMRKYMLETIKMLEKDLENIDINKMEEYHLVIDLIQKAKQIS